jgi:hypothetical protein
MPAVEPSEAMNAVYRQNFPQRTGPAPLDAWEIATASLEDFLEGATVIPASIASGGRAGGRPA